jgi:acyl-CoA oxidase
MKFWIGAAAQSATMSVVWAQLYVANKCYGVHAFIVPVRDRQTYKLLPGVLIGDCGPKAGLNGVDNGFMIF